MLPPGTFLLQEGLDAPAAFVVEDVEFQFVFQAFQFGVDLLHVCLNHALALTVLHCCHKNKI